jgi:CBS domain-containing protein/gamma-glutamylcysteine synthetase
MGEQRILDAENEGARLRSFMKALLVDLRVLEAMLERGLLESGVRRLGAEQEMFLVDRDWRPAPAALKVIERVQDRHFTTELGLFNLEMNLDVQDFRGDGLRRMEDQIVELLEKVRQAGEPLGVQPVLVGILPTIRKSDLGLDNMVPFPRYMALNKAMTRLRGKDYEISIKGVDELMFQHDTVMVEACNASFQVHLQVDPHDFARVYNVAQAVTGPVLAAATNSATLLGKRLWHETRIAVFQQAVDTRGTNHHVREKSPRVDFGRAWVRESVLEIYREDVARYRVLIAAEVEEDPFQALSRGQAPDLRALRLHNGTVYRWNRACYGVTDGKAHLRIEARVLPSGPTPLDEVANAAFWLGLMNALIEGNVDVTRHMSFDEAKLNFLSAGRLGLATEMHWFDGATMPAPRLILDRLLPLARDGLRVAKIDEGDVERYLGTIERRVAAGRTGSRWALKSLASFQGHGTESERLNAITAATVARQKTNEPVATWPLAELAEAGGWRHNYLRVEQYMETDLVTVHEDELVDLVASLMVWRRVRYVLVEDAQNHLVGIVSYRALLRALSDGSLDGPQKAVPVSEVVRRDTVTVAPETSSVEAIRLMREHGIGCLPVVKDGRLVGVLTEGDFLEIAAELLEQNLKGP